MNHDLINTLDGFMSATDSLSKIIFSGETTTPLPMAYQVNFPRLELVVDGSIEMTIGGYADDINKIQQTRSTALFVPPDGWNKPEWMSPVTTLSLLFSKQQIGFSLMHWSGSNFEILAKDHITISKSRICELLIQALNEISLQTEHQDTAIQLVKALISFSIESLRDTKTQYSRGYALFNAVRNFIEKNYQQPLTRESVAAEFFISPNYLSWLFRKEGHITFNDFINFVRLERAKYLLKRFDITIHEIAQQCGFNDSNYFCRIFKKKTALAPSEYRKQFRINQ
ncbi:AraC family transcriptional regulator [Tolumonas osonensis]|uniref:AraC-like DNA-binding protein n=1 Tax=Tolumonas osonensis TaxID=675874 RepID=A0A841G6C7_9GAMM|nr:AraC family transcriptional regulator [Tolumonas osonensis]MBB6054438.1 AraC-like DNA-binding protein [Tolumonas osonensis]